MPERANYFHSTKCKHCIKQKVTVGEIRLRNFILILQGRWFFCGWYWIVVGTQCQCQTPFEGASVDHAVKIPVWFCNFIFYVAVWQCFKSLFSHSLGHAGGFNSVAGSLHLQHTRTQQAWNRAIWVSPFLPVRILKCAVGQVGLLMWEQANPGCSLDSLSWLPGEAASIKHCNSSD